MSSRLQESMNPMKSLRYALVCATALGGLALARPAAAQTDTQIQSIEQQIKALQSQLGQVKADLATRDRALKAAQEQAKAAQQQAAAASAQAAQIAAAPPPVVVAAPVPTEPPLPPGSFHLGGLTVTLGGFAAVEGVDRSRNQASSVDTSFGSIPLRNSPNFNIPEYRESSQQSRLSLLTEGQLDDAQKLTGYVETDFLSAGSSSNSNQSNSYTLRLRQFWGAYDNTDLGLHVLGGQAWSLATMYKTGLIPRQENVPLTIDAQYVVGFDWARQAELRVVKDFDDQKIWAGLSIEEPQTLFSPSGGNNCLTGATTATAVGGGTQESDQCGGSNVNSIQQFSDNYEPDIIAKVAADPGWGHYELYGLLRFLDGRVTFNSTGTGKGYQTTGEGIGGGMILPLVPKMLDFQISGLIGQGVGRYGTSQLADATFSPTGKIEPLAEYSIMGGFVGHPVPSVDLYAYGGAEGVQQKSFAGTAGYGNPNVSLADCDQENGSCAAVTSAVIEGTVGGWWRVIKSIYGTAEVGAQYEYIDRNTYAGVGATKGSSISPNTNENVFLFSVRYLPFN
jgi:Tfp pilus assembly protein PilN